MYVIINDAGNVTDTFIGFFSIFENFKGVGQCILMVCRQKLLLYCYTLWSVIDAADTYKNRIYEIDEFIFIIVCGLFRGAGC